VKGSCPKVKLLRKTYVDDLTQCDTNSKEMCICSIIVLLLLPPPKNILFSSMSVYLLAGLCGKITQQVFKKFGGKVTWATAEAFRYCW